MIDVPTLTVVVIILAAGVLGTALAQGLAGIEARLEKILEELRRINGRS